MGCTQSQEHQYVHLLCHERIIYIEIKGKTEPSVFFLYPLGGGQGGCRSYNK